MTGDDLFEMLKENLSIIISIKKIALFAFVCKLGKNKEIKIKRENGLV